MSGLQRFVDAQRDAYDGALGELRAGRKRGHWMWFVFPQLAGLGRSATAQQYAIADLDEARAYAAHHVLGPRLVECAGALADLPEQSTADGVLGSTDAMKLRSSLTLFQRAAPDEPVFGRLLERWFDGPDVRTLQLLST